MREPKKIKLLAKAYTIEILKALSREPLRFVDLKRVCPNDRTRSLRIRELKKAGFITITIMEVKNRSFIYYQVSGKGREVLELVSRIEDCED